MKQYVWSVEHLKNYINIYFCIYRIISIYIETFKKYRDVSGWKQNPINFII